MKSKIFASAVIAVTVFSLSGCDFFRVVAGRPTSAELKNTKTEVPCDSICVPSDTQCDSCDSLKVIGDSIFAAVDSLCATISDILCTTISDSLCACGDTLAVPADTLIAPADTLCAPTDTLAAAADTVSAPVETISVPSETVSDSSDVNVRQRSDVVEPASYKYCVIIGTFKDRNNAMWQKRRAERAGYEAVTIDCRSGMVAVGVNPTDDFQQARNTFKKVKKASFCPSDAFIMVSE